MKNISLFMGALLLMGCFQSSLPAATSRTPQSRNSLYSYQEKLVQDPTPYLLPVNHPLKPILDSIFPKRDVIKNEKTFADAGFITIRAQRTSGIRLARHPKLKGYVVKLYLDSQEHHRSAYEQQDWLIQRCRGAARLRELIAKGKFEHFVVPDKWLYKLPAKAGDNGDPTFIVVATYMHLVEKKETSAAWKTKPTRKDLRQLLALMKNGGASGALVLNTPYTQEGKFAFIDTEYPDRFFQKEKLQKVTRYLSPENQRYWNSLIKEEK